MAIKVTYFYSACVRIDTANLKVICDPWFTDGAYDGSWYQFPRLANPLEKLGPADFIYVSHIHPDHYDPTFLRAYLTRYPRTEILIAPFRHPHLLRKMLADGFAPSCAGSRRVGETLLDLVPNEDDPADPNDIDSALVVRWRNHAVVNMNDNLFSASHVRQIRQLCEAPQIVLLGYTGAGPYPQTYYEPSPELAARAAAKKEEFFARYRRMRDALGPRVTVPFAGKYWLGGKLARLNSYRGVADAVEVTAFDPNAVVLDDGGDASIDTATLTPTRVREAAYPSEAVADFLRTIAERPMLYEAMMPMSSVPLLPFRRLLDRAYASAVGRSRCRQDHFFCIAHYGAWLVINANPVAQGCAHRTDVSDLTPRSEITIDPRHLFGLLTGIFHWNNAEVGSHLRVRRIPDVFNRDAQRFLNFFCV